MTRVRALARKPAAVASLAWLALVVFAAAVPGLLASRGPLTQDLAASLQGPSVSHPLGTDILGRDLLSRVAYGAAGALSGTLVALAVAVALGVTLGLLAGFAGGPADAVISRISDILFAIPAIVILLVVVGVFPRNVTAAMAAFGVLSAPGLIRIVRGAAIATRGEPFVAAAQVLGLTRSQILWRHLAPRLSSLVIVQASLIAAIALVLQSGLGFLGFGPQPPAPSWGGMVNDALAVIGRDSWSLLPPGLAIGLTALAIALLGDSVRDISTESWARSHLTRRTARASGAATASKSTSRGMVETAADEVLSVRNLAVAIPMRSGLTTVVDDVTFHIDAGERVGIIGESGCGKTVTALSILGLAPGNGTITAGQILFRGQDLASMTQHQLESVRGRSIGFVSQEPTASLDPTFRVGAQLAEAIRFHTGASRAAARVQAVDMLARVRLPEPENVARRYPHQVSGGMAQRVAIAIALAGNPTLLIADEPTTALDVTVQAGILALLRSLSQERHMSLLIITHDWGVVADICDRAVVMYAGQVVEASEASDMFHTPMHPYTTGLRDSNPALTPAGRRLPAILGNVPQPGAWPSGCRFEPRCPHASAECRAAPVQLTEPTPGHQARCIKARALLQDRVPS